MRALAGRVDATRWATNRTVRDRVDIGSRRGACQQQAARVLSARRGPSLQTGRNRPDVLYPCSQERKEREFDVDVDAGQPAVRSRCSAGGSTRRGVRFCSVYTGHRPGTRQLVLRRSTDGRGSTEGRQTSRANRPCFDRYGVEATSKDARVSRARRLQRHKSVSERRLLGRP